jgi:hypothetical protein
MLLYTYLSYIDSKGEGRREKGEGRKAQLVMMYSFELLFIYLSEGGVVRSCRVCSRRSFAKPLDPS